MTGDLLVRLVLCLVLVHSFTCGAESTSKELPDGHTSNVPNRHTSKIPNRHTSKTPPPVTPSPPRSPPSLQTATHATPALVTSNEPAPAAPTSHPPVVSDRANIAPAPPAPAPPPPPTTTTTSALDRPRIVEANLEYRQLLTHLFDGNGAQTPHTNTPIRKAEIILRGNGSNYPTQKFEKSNVPINPKQPKLFVSPGEDPANRDGRQNHPQNAGPQDRREKDVFLSSKPSAELVLLVVCAVLFCVLFTGLIRWGIKRRGRDKHGLTLTDHQRRMMQCVPLHARKPPDWTMATIYECEETPEVSPSPPSTQRTSCVVDIGTSRPDVPHQDLPPRPSGFPDTSSTEGLSLLSDRATSQSGTAQDTLLEDLEGSGSSSEDDMWSADECAGRYIPEISSPHSTSVASTTRESNNISTDRNPCGAGCRVVHEDQVLLLPPSHSQQLEATTAPGADSNNNNENTNDNNSGNNKNIRSGSTGSRFLSSLTETLRHFNRDWVGMNLLQTRPSERENSERTNHCRGSAHENSRDAQHNSLRGGDGSGHSSDFSHHPPQATPSLSHSTPPTDTTTPPTDITTPPMSHFTPPTDSTTPPTDSTTPPTDSTTPPTDSTPPQPSVETEIVYDDSFPARPRYQQLEAPQAPILSSTQNAMVSSTSPLSPELGGGRYVVFYNREFNNVCQSPCVHQNESPCVHQNESPCVHQNESPCVHQNGGSDEGTAHEDLYSVVFRSRADRPCTPPPQARHLRPCMRRSIERRRIHRHYSNRHQHIYANAPQSTHDSPAQHTAPTAPSMSQLLLHAYNHAHSHAHNHAHTHSHAHTYSHAHSHAHNHAHTQSQTGDSQAPSAVIDERLTTDDTVRPPPPNYSQHTSPGQQPSLSQSQTAPHTSCQPSLSQSQTAPHMSCQPSLSQSQTSPHMSCQPSLSQSQTAPHMSCQPSLSQSQTSPHMSCQPSLSQSQTSPHMSCQPSLSQSQTSPHMSCQPPLSQSQTAPHTFCRQDRFVIEQLADGSQIILVPPPDLPRYHNDTPPPYHDTPPPYHD